jgi:hypothetical protein
MPGQIEVKNSKYENSQDSAWWTWRTRGQSDRRDETNNRFPNANTSKQENRRTKVCQVSFSYYTAVNNCREYSPTFHENITIFHTDIDVLTPTLNSAVHKVTARNEWVTGLVDLDL